jgi:hypothetical protein
LEFDAGLSAQPARTQQKLSQLDAKLPATFRLPMDFDELASAPDGVTPPTTRIWLTAQLKAAYLRAASSGPGAMVWPGSTRCTQHLAFMLPATTLLVSGAPGSCTSSETTVRSALAQSAIDACVDVDLPERYVMGSVVPTGLSQTQLNSYVDQRTQNLESQIALAGAGLSAFPVPDGFLPTDWVPTMRSVLWKLREGPHATRLSNARTGYTTALNTLTTNAACFDATKSAALQMQVQQLDAELSALQLQVATVIADGTARAAQQATCLATRSRTRPALPIPSLTDEEREFVAFWLGGVYWRMRGGGLLPLGSTQNARTYFARRPLREIANLANGTITGTRAADSLYCALFDGWGEWMDMGTTAGGQDMYEDLVQMTDRGRQQVADWTLSATGAALTNGLSNSKSAEQYVREAGYSTTALYAGGLSMGPCYLYALNPMKNFVYDVPGAAQAPYGPFIDAFTAQGEFCFGAALGLGLTRSFLEGTPTNQPPVNFCNSRQCGVDSCGVSCGTCAGSSTCNSSGMCVAPTTDAGVDAGPDEDAGMADAGIDSGVGLDAGTDEDAGIDAGLPPDEDAGIDQPDASMPMMIDAGESTSPSPPAGCGCDASPFAFTMLALALFRRRRSS